MQHVQPLPRSFQNDVKSFGIRLLITLWIAFCWALFFGGLAALVSAPAHAQGQHFSQFRFVNAYPGPDVGTKIAAAQSDCSNALPCIIEIDADLAAFPEGTLPSACAGCVWIDYRTANKVKATNWCLLDGITCLGGAGGGAPASPDTSVQFNDGGVFGGSPGFVWNKTSKNLHVFGVDSSATALQAETYGTSAQTSSSPGLTVGAQYDGSADLFRLRGMYAVAGKDTSDASTVANTEAIFIDSIYANHGTITDAIGLNINDQAAGTHNYGIKIGNIGLSTANDFAIRTGWGKSVFGVDSAIALSVWPDDPDWGGGLTSVPVGADFVIGDASTNAHTVRHTHFYTGNQYPGLIMSSNAGTGAVPQIDLYGNTNHTYVDSGIFTVINHSGVASSITTTNTGGDVPATGNSIGLQISASGSGGTNSGLALELTGSGSDYDHSVALQIDSGGRAYMSGGVQLNTTNSQPTCHGGALTTRGLVWAVQGAAGVADVIQVCMKDAANAYAWHTVTIP